MIDTIKIDGVHASIVRHKDGSTNFDDLLSKDEESEAIKFDIDGVQVTNAALKLSDEMGNRHLEISDLSLRTGHVAKNQPIDLQTNFAVKGDNPAINAKMQLKGTLLADSAQKQYGAHDLDFTLQGDVSTLKSADLKLSGDLSAKPERMEFSVDGLKLALQANVSGQMTTLKLDAPSLSARDNEVSGKEVRLSLAQTKGDDKLSANLVIADLKGSPSAFQSSSVSGDLAGHQGARKLDGKFSTPFSGNLKTLVFDLPKLAGNIDLKDPALPGGAMQTAFQLGIHADIRQELAKATVDATVDSIKLKGDIGVAHFAQPHYSFNLDIDRIDANRYLPANNSKTSTATAAEPAKPLDLSALKALNAAGSLHLGQLKYAKMQASDIRINLKADAGQIAISPFSAKLYDGNMNGTLNLDARSTPALALKQEIKGINIGPLLLASLNNDMLEGLGSLHLDVQTRGTDINAMKLALNGNAALLLADGAVKGVDIAGTIRDIKNKFNFKGNALAADQKKRTDFSEMSASFKIANGVAHNDDLNMKSPLLRINGSGDIDIGHETLNYTARPTVVASLKGQGGSDLDSLSGLTFPVKVTGSFTDPKYGLDFGAIGLDIAKKSLLTVGGKGGVLQGLAGGAAGALGGLIGGKQKTTDATTGGNQPAPATPADSAKKKLNKLLGF